MGSPPFRHPSGSFSGRYLKLFTVPVTGGPESNWIPNAVYAAIHPTAALAYTPYRMPPAMEALQGGSISKICCFLQGLSVDAIPNRKRM